MRLLISSFVAWSAIAVSALAEPITYDVGSIPLYAPQANTPDYVLSGTITTNGKIGALSASDFISWSLNVNGPVPYHLHPGNPSPHVEPSFVSASADYLITTGQFGWLFIEAESEPTSSCTNCVKRVFWRAWIAGDASYQNYRANDAPIFRSSIPYGDNSLIIGTRIPEPLSLPMALLGAAVLTGMRKRHCGVIP